MFCHQSACPSLLPCGFSTSTFVKGSRRRLPIKLRELIAARLSLNVCWCEIQFGYPIFLFVPRRSCGHVLVHIQVEVFINIYKMCVLFLGEQVLDLLSGIRAGTVTVSIQHTFGQNKIRKHTALYINLRQRLYRLCAIRAIFILFE